MIIVVIISSINSPFQLSLSLFHASHMPTIALFHQLLQFTLGSSLSASIPSAPSSSSSTICVSHSSSLSSSIPSSIPSPIPSASSSSSSSSLYCPLHSTADSSSLCAKDLFRLLSQWHCIQDASTIITVGLLQFDG